MKKGEYIMKIDKVQNGQKLILALDGELDSIQSKLLEEEIVKISEEVTDLTLDLEKLEYTSSAGIRTFLLANRTMKEKKGTLKIIKVNNNVYEILKMASLIDVLNPEKI